MKKTIGILVFALCLGAAANADQGKTPSTEPAVAAAEAWLALTDQGNYEESWQQAAPYFRKAVSTAQWQQSMKAFRDPLGRVLSRRPAAADYETSLPGAPDGHYVVIRFETSFANKQKAVETVTPMRCEDGAWRVSGYFIK